MPETTPGNVEKAVKFFKPIGHPHDEAETDSRSKKRPKHGKVDDDEDEDGMLLSLSFNGSCKKLRGKNINLLHRLLTKLVRHHNWVEASGVLCLLLKETPKDKSPTNNRNKYQSAMEILKHMEGGSPKFRKIQKIFDIWMAKNGLMKNWPVKDRNAVLLEYTVYCIRQEKAEDAEQAAICLMQQHEFDKDPVSNMVVGMTYCLSWYSLIQNKLRVEKFPLESEISKEQDIHNEQKDALYLDSAGCKEENCTFCIQEDNNPHGFASWLMPFNLPCSKEKLGKLFSSYRNTFHTYYEDAIRHLRIALYSSPPLYEALLPLVQMLLLDYNIDDALDELNKFGDSSVLGLRAKASLLEHVDCDNYWQLCDCFEDILRKDPSCSHSLAKLISFHHKGEHIYSSHQLLEMIALHLEAHNTAHANVWKECACCFIKVCVGGEDHLYRVHEIFTRGKLGKSWNLRCRWWLNLHFNLDILSSEIKAGDGHLLAYKAAAACHMYGRDSEYVLKACLYVKEHHNHLFSFLHKHMQNSVGFYSKILKR